MRIKIANIGPPADRFGAIVAPGAIPNCNVPLCDGFDPYMPIGRAVVYADGTADLQPRDGITLDVDRLEADATIGIAF